jgi:hypothetical protein
MSSASPGLAEAPVSAPRWQPTRFLRVAPLPAGIARRTVRPRSATIPLASAPGRRRS